MPKCGVLKKYTNFMNGYQDRYFEIRNGRIAYFYSKADRANCRGQFSMKNVLVEAHMDNSRDLILRFPGDIVWYLQAEDAVARDQWLKALTKEHVDSDYSSASTTTHTHSRNPSISSATELRLPLEKNLPFGCFDHVQLPGNYELHAEVEEITMQQLRYAMEGVDNSTWTLFAEDGQMKMFKREVEMDGLPVDPLKALHHVKGVSALEYMHYFFDPRYKKNWDHTLEAVSVLDNPSPDTALLHQRHKTIWPAASRESLFWTHIRRVDAMKSPDAADLYIVCNKDVIREDVPLGTSSSVRVKLTVSMVCETLIAGNKPAADCTRADVSCRILYVSCVHPGGWVPTAALRTVYKKEYPKFLRTFTEFVLSNVKDKPLAM
ncbi:unnamed protein product, partial [Mesorhabditis spiculigera]